MRICKLFSIIQLSSWLSSYLVTQGMLTPSVHTYWYKSFRYKINVYILLNFGYLSELYLYMLLPTIWIKSPWIIPNPQSFVLSKPDAELIVTVPARKKYKYAGIIAILEILALTKKDHKRLRLLTLQEFTH